ncbi:uncharacterized protein LAESUDRAFT_688399 [Laetiporus sulphureus 93-53]|uniref:Macrofage activating glyco protein n=1 Tax=Laetiporus sulphureus 93-53 TaxID=1314785 RepID=A0A165B4E2_9APHY|nr:uncharacterized protein LAESUDRAFT_688399 [Laetiporus sulphureus 93-53]KZT00208.1 hypothetical protein LAESUDRAFT_688399 [Laetiporus sulphureus 93-53]
MTAFALSALVAAAAVLTDVRAQTTTSIEPLVDHTYPYSDVPYQVEPTGDERGSQVGYNICNSTTQNQDSYCQTLIVNEIDDFCIYSSPDTNDTIGDSESYEVAWCTSDTHGTRLIPEGALKGVQYIYTANYIQIIGYIDQTQVNLQADDAGGELDPHGSDLLGNPMGAIVYSNQYPRNNTDNSTYTQIIEWTEFIGNDMFCLKICNPANTSADNVGWCNNIYDEIGISYNCPNAAQNGTFEVCDGDSMTPVGVYTSDGQTYTWTQPYTGELTIPYTPTIPASSNCRTFASTDLYTAKVSTTASLGASSATAVSSGASGDASSGATSASSGASRTGTSGSASSTSTGTTSSAGAVRMSALATFAGVAFMVAFLA